MASLAQILAGETVSAEPTATASHRPTAGQDMRAFGSGVIRENPLANPVALYNAVDAQMAEETAAEPGYNVFEDGQVKAIMVRDPNAISAFATSESRKETAIRLRRYQRSQALLDDMAASPIYGMAGGVTGALASPSSFVGFVGAVSLIDRVRRLGTARSQAGAFALATGGAVAAEEAVLQANDPTRSGEESALAIGAATALAFGLGHIAARVTPIDQIRMQRSLSAPEVSPAVESALHRVLNDFAESPESVGAAVSPNRRINTAAEEDHAHRLVTAAWLERMPDNPIKRIFNATSLVAREATEQLADVVLLLNKNRGGDPTARSVETDIRMWRRNLVDGMRGVEDGFMAFRQRTTGEAAGGIVRQQGRDLLRGEAYRFGDFRMDVARELRGIDTGIPEARQAAESARKAFYEPIGKALDQNEVFSGPIKKRIASLEGFLKEAETSRTAKAGAGAPPPKSEKILKLEEELAALQDDLARVTKQGGMRANFLNRVYRRDRILADMNGWRAMLRRNGLEPDQIDEVTEKILQDKGFTPMDEFELGFAPTLKARSLDIPDAELEPFLESDVFALMQAYARQTVPDLELTRRFGSIGMEDQIKAVRAEYDELIEAATTAAEKTRLREEQASVVADIEGLRDMIRGTYGLPDDPHRWQSRAIRMAKHITAMTLLSGALAAVPDLGRIVMAEGIMRTFGQGLLPFARGLGAFKLARREAELAGEALDFYLGTRAALFADVGDAFGVYTPLEQGVARLSQAGFSVNLMNQWNVAAKSIASMVSGTRMIDDMKEWAMGGFNVKAQTNLAAVGIDQNMAGRIAHEFANHGVTEGSVKIANTDRWADKAAARAFQGALSLELNRIIVTPAAGDAPLFMSSELGGLFFQFKKFGASSMQRVLISGMQGRDANFMAGALSMVALGMMVDRVRASAFDMNWEKRPLREKLLGGIDRSGLLGWFADANNAIETLSMNNIGLAPMLGVEQPYGPSGRRVSGTIAPAGAVAMDVANLAGDLSVFGERDRFTARHVRRLLPYQNVFYADSLFDGIEKGLAAGMKAVPGN